MGPWGSIIMSFFGAVFLTAATVTAIGWKTPFLLIPCLAFAAIATIASHRINRAPNGRFEPDARAERLIARSSIAEGILIPVVAMTLANTGHNDLVLPGIALVVGLHFLPMAYAIPSRPFYLLAAALILAAAAGMVLHQPAGSIIAALTASLALFLASAVALSRNPPSPT